MSNVVNKAYALTVLSPIREEISDGNSGAVLTRAVIDELRIDENGPLDSSNSPLSLVPNTYLARFYILDDVFFEGAPAKEDHLKSKYLVFSSNFYGDRDDYLKGFWENAETHVKKIWQYCYGFDQVNSAAGFVDYIKKCQIDTSYFFNGSVDDEDDVSLNDQLKALYVKQEFSKFAWENQGKSASELKAAFKEFTDRTQPSQDSPRWAPGKCDVA